MSAIESGQEELTAVGDLRRSAEYGPTYNEIANSACFHEFGRYYISDFFTFVIIEHVYVPRFV